MVRPSRLELRGVSRSSRTWRRDAVAVRMLSALARGRKHHHGRRNRAVPIPRCCGSSLAWRARDDGGSKAAAHRGDHV